MTKTLTEQWNNGELPSGYYYLTNGKETYIHECFKSIHKIVPSRFTILAPVPSYRELYGENDGNMPTGVFTILKIIKRDIDNAQKRRSLTDLECGIKSQVVSLLKKWGVK
jgi:hypothetical protein